MNVLASWQGVWSEKYLDWEHEVMWLDTGKWA